MRTRSTENPFEPGDTEKTRSMNRQDAKSAKKNEVYPCTSTAILFVAGDLVLKLSVLSVSPW
jgi:hypothetical protein